MAPRTVKPTESTRLSRVEEAIFGDGNGDIGMKEKVDDMYTMFSGSQMGAKIVRNIIYFLSAFFTALYVVWNILHGKNPF
jgi:hypothetical protein